MARCKRRSEKEKELARNLSDESAIVVLTRRWRSLRPLLHLLLWLLFDTAALVSFLLCWWFSFAPYIRWRSLRSCPYCGLLNSLGGQVSGVGSYLSQSEIFLGISCEELSREGFFFCFPSRSALSFDVIAGLDQEKNWITCVLESWSFNLSQAYWIDIWCDLWGSGWMESGVK